MVNNVKKQLLININSPLIFDEVVVVVVVVVVVEDGVNDVVRCVTPQLKQTNFIDIC